MVDGRVDDLKPSETSNHIFKRYFNQPTKPIRTIWDQLGPVKTRWDQLEPAGTS